MNIFETIRNISGFEGVVVKRECLGEIESGFKIKTGEELISVITRDDCLSDFAIQAGDAVTVQIFPFPSLFPPRITKHPDDGVGENSLG